MYFKNHGEESSVRESCYVMFSLKHLSSSNRGGRKWKELIASFYVRCYVKKIFQHVYLLKRKYIYNKRERERHLKYNLLFGGKINFVDVEQYFVLLIIKNIDEILAKLILTFIILCKDYESY